MNAMFNLYLQSYMRHLILVTRTSR